MKRTSKLLAVLMSLCVAFSLVAVFAFAAEPTSQLDASQYGNGNIVNFSFKKVKTGELFDASNGLDPDYTGGNGVSTYTKQVVTTTDGNTYMKLKKNPAYLTYEAMAGASKSHLQKPNNEYEYVNAYCGTGASSAVALVNYDYIVWSLDFMTDAVKENGKLNYLDEGWFGTYGDAYRYNYIVKDLEGDWYMSGDSEYSAEDAPLASEPGAWNNLTVVASRENAKVYSFVNGRHFATKNAPEAYKVDRVVFNAWNSYDIYNPDWSISVDNVSLNAYAKDYVSTVEYGLDDYFSDLDLSRYISECDDVVYNSNYALPSVANTEKYVVEKNGVRETVTDHYQFSRSVSSLKAGDAVTSYIKLDTLLDAANITYVKSESGYCFNYYITGKVGAADANIVEGALTSRSSGGTTSCFNYYYEEVGKDFVLSTAFSKNFFGIRSGSSYTGTVSNSNYNFYLGPKGGTGSGSYPTSKDYKYVTMDFNIAAAGYVYLPDGATDGIYKFIGNIDGLTETEKATAKLSYWEGSRIAILSSGWDFAWYFISKDGQWYLSYNDKVFSEDDVPLASNVGEWNHVSFMHEVKTGKLLVYLNGKYAVTGKLKAAEFERFSFLHIDGAAYSEHDIRYSGLDIKYYKNAYTSGNDKFGIDDYFAMSNVEKYDASFIEDVSLGVNSKNYAVPASVKLERGEQTLYFKNIAQALVAAKTGDTIYYGGELNLYRQINQELETFNVVAAGVTLQDAAALIHEYNDGVISRKKVFSAVWLDENGEEIKTDLVGINAIPDFTSLSFQTSIKGDYNQVKAWKWAHEGSDSYAPLSTIAGIAVGATVYIVPDCVDVAWFDLDGNMLEAESWFVGSVACRDFSDFDELEVLENGWYELAYFWNSSAEDMTIVSGEERAFMPVIEPVEAFTGLRYNYTLGAYFYVNHYVPVPEDGIGVTVTGARFGESVDTEKLSAAKPHYNDLEEATKKILSLDIHSTVNINGADYYKFYNGSANSAFAWYGLQGFEVNFTVDYEDVQYELSSKVALTRLGTKADEDYTGSYILDALKIYKCGSEECALIVNMARYISQSYAMQGKYITFGDVDNILKNHADCGCIKSLESYMPTEAPATDASGLAAAPGFAASFRSNHSASMLAIYVPTEIADANPDLTIKATLNGAIVDGATTLKTVTLDFARLTDLEGDITATSGGVKCYIYSPDFEQNSAYNAALVYNITISYGGNEYKGTYSLQTYLYNRNKNLNTYVYNDETGAYEMNSEITALDINHRSVQLLLAQLAYVEAARNYKLN